jgi:hypothetical protein
MTAITANGGATEGQEGMAGTGWLSTSGRAAIRPPVPAVLRVPFISRMGQPEVRELLGFVVGEFVPPVLGVGQPHSEPDLGPVFQLSYVPLCGAPL